MTSFAIEGISRIDSNGADSSVDISSGIANLYPSVSDAKKSIFPVVTDRVLVFQEKPTYAGRERFFIIDITKLPHIPKEMMLRYVNARTEAFRREPLLLPLPDKAKKLRMHKVRMHSRLQLGLSGKQAERNKQEVKAFFKRRQKHSSDVLANYFHCVNAFSEIQTPWSLDYLPNSHKRTSLELFCPSLWLQGRDRVKSMLTSGQLTEFQEKITASDLRDAGLLPTENSPSGQILDNDDLLTCFGAGGDALKELKATMTHPNGGGSEEGGGGCFFGKGRSSDDEGDGNGRDQQDPGESGGQGQQSGGASSPGGAGGSGGGGGKKNNGDDDPEKKKDVPESEEEEKSEKKEKKAHKRKQDASEIEKNREKLKRQRMERERAKRRKGTKYENKASSIMTSATENEYFAQKDKPPSPSAGTSKTNKDKEIEDAFASSVETYVYKETIVGSDKVMEREKLLIRTPDPSPDPDTSINVLNTGMQEDPTNPVDITGDLIIDLTPEQQPEPTVPKEAQPEESKGSKKPKTKTIDIIREFLARARQIDQDTGEKIVMEYLQSIREGLKDLREDDSGDVRIDEMNDEQKLAFTRAKTIASFDAPAKCYTHVIDAAMAWNRERNLAKKQQEMPPVSGEDIVRLLGLMQELHPDSPETEDWYRWEQTLLSCDASKEMTQEEKETLERARQFYENVKQMLVETRALAADDNDVLGEVQSQVDLKKMKEDRLAAGSRQARRSKTPERERPTTGQEMAQDVSAVKDILDPGFVHPAGVISSPTKGQLRQQGVPKRGARSRSRGRGKRGRGSPRGAGNAEPEVDDPSPIEDPGDDSQTTVEKALVQGTAQQALYTGMLRKTNMQMKEIKDIKSQTLANSQAINEMKNMMTAMNRHLEVLVQRENLAESNAAMRAQMGMTILGWDSIWPIRATMRDDAKRAIATEFIKRNVRNTTHKYTSHINTLLFHPDYRWRFFPKDPLTGDYHDEMRFQLGQVCWVLPHEFREWVNDLICDHMKESSKRTSHPDDDPPILDKSAAMESWHNNFRNHRNGSRKRIEMLYRWLNVWKYCKDELIRDFGEMLYLDGRESLYVLWKDPFPAKFNLGEMDDYISVHLLDVREKYDKAVKKRNNYIDTMRQQKKFDMDLELETLADEVVENLTESPLAGEDLASAQLMMKIAAKRLKKGMDAKEVINEIKKLREDEVSVEHGEAAEQERQATQEIRAELKKKFLGLNQGSPGGSPGGSSSASPGGASRSSKAS